MTTCDEVRPLGELKNATGEGTHRPIRILHVLGGMDIGGVETWLMHVLRNIDRERFRMDFMVHTDRRCAYDDELESLGSRLFYCPSPSNPLRYAMHFRRIVREHGPFDVVHSHVHHYSGWVLLVAKMLGVQCRIAHSHTAEPETSGSLLRRTYVGGARWLIQKCASLKLAVSKLSANSLFGSEWASDPTTCLLYCGLDFTPFCQEVESHAVRAELGIDSNDLVVGHVGRFVPQKNHDFLLKIHFELLKREPRALLLLIGKGPLEQQIRIEADTLGISNRIRFVGVRADVPRIMKGAMDLFLMPSRCEGLGMVAIEAQAAGLPTVLSENIPEEVDSLFGSVRRVSLERTPGEWATEIRAVMRRPRVPAIKTLTSLLRSPFSITNNLERLCKLYSQTV